MRFCPLSLGDRRATLTSLILLLESIGEQSGDVGCGGSAGARHRSEGPANAKIRHGHFVEVKSIKRICRALRLSRNTVRKVIRSGVTELTHDRTTQTLPKIDPRRSALDALPAENARRPKRQCLTLIRVYEELRNRG